MAFDPKEEARLQKEKLQIQKEYNEALKMSQSISGQINDAISSQIDYRTKIGKKVKEYHKDLKSSISELSTSEDVAKKLVEIEAEKVRISKSYVGANKAQGDAMLAALIPAEAGLKIEQERLIAIEKVRDGIDGLAEKASGALDGLLDKGGQIPVIGGLFKSMMEGPVSKMKDGIANAGKTFVTDFAGNLRGGMGGFQALQAAGGKAFGVLKAAINPVTLGILAIGAGIMMAIGRFNAIQDAAKKFREETGLLNSQTQGLVKNITSVSRDMAGLGVSAEDVANAASVFTKEFDNLAQPSKGVLTSVVAMEKSFGVSAANQAKVNEQFQRMAGVSAETAQSMIQTTVQAAKLAGVAPSQVMADIAENSEASYKFFNGSPEALAKAAVEAAKLGTSITQAANTADKLLDFESSINAELNASAMLGTNINFNKARQLAANKDIVGAQKAVVDEVSKLGDLTKLSVFEQEALAEAAGMPIGDLIQQQQIRENLGDLGEEQLAAANKLIAAGMEAKDITSEQLNQEAQRLAQQNEMQSQNEKLKNSLAGLGAGFADVFMPVINFVMPLINDLIDMVSSVLMPVFKILGAVFKVTFGILSAVIQPIFAVFKALVAAVAEPFDRIGDALQPLGDKFAELKDKIMPYLEPIIGIISSIGNIIGNIVGGAVGLLIDGLMFLFDTAFSIFSSIAGFINTYLIEPIMSFVNGIGNVLGSIGSFFGLGGDSATEAATQSAGPTETAVAAVGPDVAMASGGIVKGPTNALIGEAGPEAVLPLNEMYAKFDEMIAAFRETKDVYMDGKKVTSGVNRVVDNAGGNTYSLG
jgi:hypothetical protein